MAENISKLGWQWGIKPQIVRSPRKPKKDKYEEKISPGHNLVKVLKLKDKETSLKKLGPSSHLGPALPCPVSAFRSLLCSEVKSQTPSPPPGAPSISLGLSLPIGGKTCLCQMMLDTHIAPLFELLPTS